MEAESSYETLVLFTKTRHHIPGSLKLHLHSCDNPSNWTQNVLVRFGILAVVLTNILLGCNAMQIDIIIYMASYAERLDF